MSGFSGSGSGINSEIEAKRLLFGVPPEFDPAEDHMNRFLMTVFGWTVATVAVAAAPLWLFGPLTSAIAIAAVTVLAVAVIALRRNGLRPDPLEPA